MSQTIRSNAAFDRLIREQLKAKMWEISNDLHSNYTSSGLVFGAWPVRAKGFHSLTGTCGPRLWF